MVKPTSHAVFNIRMLIACGTLAIISMIYGIRSFPARPGLSGANKKPATSARSQDGRPFDPSLNNDALAARNISYDTGKRNIFRMLEAPHPAAEQHKTSAFPPNPAPQAALPVPINLQFFGFTNRHGESKRIFLAQGDDIFVAVEGEIVNRRYKIVRVTGVSVTVEDMLNGNQQTIPLTDRPPAA